MCVKNLKCQSQKWLWGESFFNCIEFPQWVKNIILSVILMTQGWVKMTPVIFQSSDRGVCQIHTIHSNKCAMTHSVWGGVGVWSFICHVPNFFIYSFLMFHVYFSYIYNEYKPIWLLGMCQMASWKQINSTPHIIITPSKYKWVSPYFISCI